MLKKELTKRNPFRGRTIYLDIRLFRVMYEHDYNTKVKNHTYAFSMLELIFV